MSYPIHYDALISDHAYLSLCSRIINDCLVWTGPLSDGYGSLSHGRHGNAHRLAYKIWVGPVPEGLQLDHLCRNRACIWPEHLEAVTQQVNMQRGAMATRTHCSYGHPFSGDNLKREIRKTGAKRRVCLTCKRAHGRKAQAKYQAKKRAIIEGKKRR